PLRSCFRPRTSGARDGPAQGSPTDQGARGGGGSTDGGEPPARTRALRHRARGDGDPRGALRSRRRSARLRDPPAPREPDLPARPPPRGSDAMTSVALPLAVLPDNSRKRAELALALGVVFVIALLVMPLPPVLLDLFLAASIGASLVVLLTALNTVDPLDFSS